MKRVPRTSINTPAIRRRCLPFANLIHHCKLFLPDEYAFLHELIHKTNVGDFRLTTRAGYLVDLVAEPIPWIQYIHIWAEAGVPLWNHGGITPHQFADSAPVLSLSLRSALKDWASCRKVEAAYIDYAAHMSASLPPPLLLQDRLVGDRVGSLYGLSHFGFRNGDYEPGMHPEYYFLLRDSALQKWKVSKGSPADARARVEVDALQWIKAFDGHPAHVWENERDLWMRRRIVPPLRRAWFEMFPPNCRRWCPILREIDLCAWIGEPSSIPGAPVIRTPVSYRHSLRRCSDGCPRRLAFVVLRFTHDYELLPCIVVVS